jgi:glycopeptide antibiotics resistance protein
MIKTVWRMLLAFWLVSVLIVISLPGKKFDGTPHWESIQWIPFAALSFQRDVVTETLANFLAFVPIGYLAIRSFTFGIKWPLLVAGLLGLVASFSIELYQIFCRSRVPSSTDLILNTAGAVLGAHLALKLDDVISFLSRRMPFTAPHRNAEE